MITILTKDDLLKDLDNVDVYNGNDFHIPRETLHKSEIIIYINEKGEIQFLKNRNTIETSLIKLKEIGFNYEVNYKVKN